MIRRINTKKKTRQRLTGILLCLVLMASLFPMSVLSAGESSPHGPMLYQPVLLVTGDGIISDGIYTATNVGLERSYTLGELKNIANADENASEDNQYLFSAINNSSTKSFYRGEGVRIDTLLALSGVDILPNLIKVRAADDFTISFNPETVRYFYPDIVSNNEDTGVPVPSLITWAGTGGRNTAPALTSPPPETAEDFAGLLGTMVGQLDVADINNNLFSNASASQTIIAGNAISGAQITVNGTTYTRAEVLMMPRLAGSYTFSSSGGDRTDIVRGVPLSVLLEDFNYSDIIEFNAADGYDMSSYNMSKSELIAKNAILAYEVFEDGQWQGIYSTAKASAPNPSGIGYFTLYANGITPGKMIDTISLKPSTSNSYKHITNGGQGGSAPYNIDAITSATLTVEGPGVESSVPITVRELEETKDDNIHRGVYTDIRSGASTNRMYEGIKVLSILDGQVNSNVKPLDDSVVVVFKNRWRQEVGRLTYGEIKYAVAPVILAYGTASADEASMPPAPFVFNMGSGTVTGLGNEDGPLKLVYDQSAFPDVMPPNSSFASVAYMYIEEGVPPPGFKHIDATNDAYNNVANTEFILSFTGDELGREVNYTVKELEEMAGEDPTLVHRDEYGLSNTTYWYVNEYEGIMLWELLRKMGVPAGKASDDSTLVSFASWDNYQISSQFSFYQLAHPELFYFYEKSPLDMGTDRPTKEQLATPEYQPGNQDETGETWITDSNGYPVKAGYPVLLAYGVNSYPYVRNPGMNGYKSGLGNSGGPMRLIYGKTDGLNRSDPSALENYAYFFNNGSQQLQRVQEVYVGNPVRYSTHIENPDPIYQAMKNDPVLTVEINAGGTTRTETFTLTELENILYGSGVSKTDRDDGRQEKGYYVYRSNIEDLFEGVNLEYLLAEYIGMQGTLGTVELYSGADLAASFNLSTMYNSGKNSLRGTDGLGMTVAFAKNGYPLVAGSGNGSSNNANPDHADYIPGYVHNDSATGNAIRNIGGPLVFVRGQTDAETGGNVESGVDGKTYVANLTKIVVNLDADPYAHVGTGNENYAAQEIVFSGAVAKTDGASLTVGALETKQRYMVTDIYSVGGVTETYRGLDLYKLLNDRDIGASSLMDEITVIGTGGDSTTLTYSQLTAVGKKVILAYGSGEAGYETPLDFDSGGPIRLIIEGGSAEDCISNVTEIIIHAAEITSWKHEGSIYSQYANYTLEISGQNLVHNKTYTIAELEAMDNIILQDVYKVGENSIVVQGVDLYKLLQNIGFADGKESSYFTAYASDGYATEFTTDTYLSNGINGKPILIAFGQGTTPDNGLPLVPNATSPGFSSIAGNESGPLRLMVHDNSGWAVKYLTRIVVGTPGGNTDPGIDPDPGTGKEFTVYPGGTDGMPQASVRAVIPDGVGGVWIGTNGAGAAYISASGAITRYATDTTPALKTDFVTGIAIAPDGTVWLTQGGSVGSINAPSTDHYGFASFRNGLFTFYDIDSPNSTLPNNCVYGIDADKAGNIWLTTQYTTYNAEGGLTKFNPTTGVWQTWKMSNGLPTVSAWAVKGDGNGGAWVTTYRTSMTTLTWPDESYAHVNAAGAVTAYEIPGGKDLTWSRSIAIDQGGGVYITRMSGAHDPSNDGGWLDYIAPDGTVTAYKGDDLIPDLKAKSKAGFYPEIRTVFVDVAGGLWLTTNGLGVYRCTVTDGDITVVENYSSENGSWPAGSFDDVWSINVTPDGLAIFGSNGGLAMKLFDLAPPKESGFVTSQPVLVVTGQDIIGSGDYTSSNISNERSYSLADLQAMTNLTGTRLYSSLNSAGTKRIYIGEGTDVAGLLALSGYATDSGGNLTFIASDSYPASFNSTIPLNEGRLYYPKLGASADEETNPENVKALLVWKNDYITANGSDAPQLPAAETSLLLLVGQTSIDNVNNSLYNKSVQTVQAGQSMTTPVLEVGNSSYNRAQLLLMRRSTKDYTYSSSGGERTDTARGVALADLMSGLSNNTLVTFNAADGYDVSSYSMTLGELIAKDAILAYELLDGNNWQGVFATDRNDPEIQGYLRLYVDGMRPAQMIDRITFTETGIQQPDPPENLAGQKPEAAGQMGKIINTTTGMEYSDTQQTVWLPCSDGNTAVAPGQYYVRFKATNTQNASNAAFVSVPVFSGPGGGDPPPITGDAVLAVYNGSTLAKEFTQEEINNLPKITNNYSAYNNYPTYRTYTDVSGVEVMSLLSAAGLSPVGSREIIFYAYDGYSATLMADDLSASRYYFDSSGSRGGAVPAVIEFNENGGRLYLGQLAAQEQTLPSFVEKIDRIVVGGSADSWGAPTADPATSVRVKEGDPVRLALPDGSGNAAKIYYTLDGSTPTRESKIYNVIGAGWLDQQGKSENDPIIALSGTFTITARIIGLGKNDGPVTTFTYNSTGGGGGGGGGGTTTSNTGATVYEVDASKLGGAPVVTFETEDLSETIKKAVSSDSNGVLELRVNASDSAASVEAQLTAQTIKEMIDAGLKTLTVSNPLGSNSYDLAALQSIYTQGGDSGQISFLISKIDPASLDEDMQAIVGDNPLYRIEVLYNGIPIPSFGAGQATTQLNYTLKPGQSAYGLKVWHISDGGALTEIPCEYNSAGGYLEFTRNSHSYYMIAYDAVAANWTANPFADVKDGDWFYDSVRFVYEQGLMTGTSTDPMLFSPNIPLTRAMIVSILYRQSNAQIQSPALQATQGFNDVAAGLWYSEAVAWAAANGVVSGYGDGRFGPGDNITREQLAVILNNYQSISGRIPAAIQEEKVFADRERISDWATDAVRKLTMQGLISGKPGDIFDPKGNATRAETASILERFLKNTAE